jgi:hypothetical protein
MRAVLLLFVMAALSPLPRSLHAQAVSLGVRVGASKSHVVPDWAGLRRTGFTAGLSARLQLTRTLGLQVEALYSQKGWQDGDYRLFLDYLEAPVLIRLSAPPQFFGFRVAALGGVSATTELRCSWRSASGMDLQSASPPAVAQDCIGVRNQLNDFGLVVGVELERQLHPGHLTVEARYFHGMRNLSYAGNVLRNRSLAVLVGFAVDLWPGAGRLHN